VAASEAIIPQTRAERAYKRIVNTVLLHKINRGPSSETHPQSQHTAQLARTMSRLAWRFCISRPAKCWCPPVASAGLLDRYAWVGRRVLRRRAKFQHLRVKPNC